MHPSNLFDQRKDRPKATVNRYRVDPQAERATPVLFVRIGLSNGKGYRLALLETVVDLPQLDPILQRLDR